MGNKLIVTAAPHITGADSTGRDWQLVQGENVVYNGVTYRPGSTGKSNAGNCSGGYGVHAQPFEALFGHQLADGPQQRLFGRFPVFLGAYFVVFHSVNKSYLLVTKLCYSKVTCKRKPSFFTIKTLFTLWLKRSTIKP